MPSADVSPKLRISSEGWKQDGYGGGVESKEQEQKITFVDDLGNVRLLNHVIAYSNSDRGKVCSRETKLATHLLNLISAFVLPCFVSSVGGWMISVSFCVLLGYCKVLFESE
jgi:hypothetical protein